MDIRYGDIMDKYRVDYMDKDGEIITIKFEASGIGTIGDTIIFFDKYGEDEYVFYKKDVVNFKMIKEGL